jgi:hypothetical protein
MPSLLLLMARKIVRLHQSHFMKKYLWSKRNGYFSEHPFLF